MKRILNILCATLAIFTAEAQNNREFFNKADTFFKAYVSNGRVDYVGLRNNKAALDEALKIAANVKVDIASPSEYQAFWINAYNLAVIKGIVDNYPIKSPLDKAGFFDKTKYALGGTTITLNDIENKLLRAQFNDARVHFVLVCGAIGCPPIINKAYQPDTLESQLQQQTEKALNNPDFIKVEGKSVLVSEIFKWYKEDFVKKGQTEIGFINAYRKEKIPATLKLGYYTYNWNINSKK